MTKLGICLTDSDRNGWYFTRGWNDTLEKETGLQLLFSYNRDSHAALARHGWLGNCSWIGSPAYQHSWSCRISGHLGHKDATELRRVDFPVCKCWTDFPVIFSPNCTPWGWNRTYAMQMQCRSIPLYTSLWRPEGILVGIEICPIGLDIKTIHP